MKPYMLEVHEDGLAVFMGVLLPHKEDKYASNNQEG